MICCLRLCGCALVAAALAGAACPTACRLLDEVLFAPLADLLRESEEDARLSRALAAAREHVEQGAAAAGDLAHGRLSLPAAVARLQASYPEEDYRGVPGRCPDERIGWALISWVAEILEDDPGRGPLLARLQEQLRAHLAERGLPPDPEGPTWLRRRLTP